MNEGEAGSEFTNESAMTFEEEMEATERYAASTPNDPNGNQSAHTE